MKVLLGSVVALGLVMAASGVWQDRAYGSAAISSDDASDFARKASAAFAVTAPTVSGELEPNFQTQPSSQVGSICSLFTAEGFDLERMLALIESADIGDRQKSALRTTITSSAINPEFLQQSLDNAKDTLGY